MAGLCDKCGHEYFVSCHDCMHILAMLYHSVRKTLAMLPATPAFEEARNELLALKHFYEDKILANAIKPREV